MRVARRPSSARSWVTKRTAPRSSRICSSSHSITSTSRWFVGSSRSSRSGAPTSARARATRRRQPPESSPRRASAGSARRASAFSTRWLRLQPPSASRACWSCSRRRSSEGSCATSWETWWYSASSRPASASPSATTSNTVASVSSGSSWESRAIRRPGWRQTEPPSGARLAVDDPEQASTCRRRSGRSGRPVRRRRSGSSRARAGAPGRRRWRRLRSSGAAWGDADRAVHRAGR